MQTASRWINRRGLLALVVFMALFTLSLQPARAHGYIVRSIPENRAVLERPPARVQYWFSEGLEPAFSTIELRDQTGAVLATGGVDEEDTTLMVLQPPTDLPNGAYVVALRPAFASDGHVIAETRVFFVGESVGGVDSSAASDEAVPLEIVWRGIVLTSSTLLLGVFTVYSRVLRPAWGNTKYTAGFLPPRVMNALTWVAGGSLAIALAGNTLALLQNAMVLFNVPLPRVIENGLWNTARISSRFGDVWNVRMVLLLVLTGLLALAIYWRDEKPRAVAPFWEALMWGTALVIGTFAVSSHASGSLMMPWVAMSMHWLHATAVAVWVGGLAALALILPRALAPYTGENRRLALLAAMRRFSPLAVGMLLITVTTGIYNALNWLYTPESVVDTRYGIHLIYKGLLVVGLVAVGGIHHVAARPERYARWQGLINRVGGWRVTLPLEVGFAVAVLLSAGWVSATPVPTPDFVNSDVAAPRATATESNTTVQMTVSPGGPGVNTYDINLTDAADVDRVFVQMVRPSDDKRGVWHAAEPIEDSLYVAAGDEIDVGGAWLSLVDIVRDDGSTTRLVYEWDINTAASVLESIPPAPRHWAALGAVILALGYVVAPAYSAFIRRLELDTFNVSVGLVAVVVTAVASWYGYTYLQGVQQQADAVLNPEPQVINTVLPDAASIRQGATLFADRCQWDRDEDIFASLIERLPRSRDEELFNFMQDGYRTLPPCDGPLTDEERWHIVNYIRTLVLRG